MALSSGHQVICCDRNRRGGLKNIWLVESDQVASAGITVTSGIVTAFGTSNAYQFDFDRGTGGFSANAAIEPVWSFPLALISNFSIISF